MKEWKQNSYKWKTYKKDNIYIDLIKDIKAQIDKDNYPLDKFYTGVKLTAPTLEDLDLDLDFFLPFTLCVRIGFSKLTKLIDDVLIDSVSFWYGVSDAFDRSDSTLFPNVSDEFIR